MKDSFSNITNERHVNKILLIKRNDEERILKVNYSNSNQKLPETEKLL